MSNSKIGAWLTKSAEGKQRGIKFTIEGKIYIMFNNLYKTKDIHPDYIIIESKPNTNEQQLSDYEN
jgi:hypothetical protein